MLKRIQKISGVGSYTSATAGSVELQDVNVIYGENRNGKSTLCDVLASLANNDPNLLMRRKAITKAGEQSTEQFVQFQFKDDNKVQFQQGQWSKQLTASKLYIFDQGFAHRNVMTGIEVGRGNSESVSDFILGEEGVRIASQLEGKKQAVKSARKNLKDSETRLRELGVDDIAEFVEMDHSSYPLQSLNEDLDDKNAKAHQINTQLEQLSKLLARKQPTAIDLDLGFTNRFEQINKCLSASTQGAHEQSQALIDAQMLKVNANHSFKGWVVSGTDYLDSDCPFCGQHLYDDANKLITAYREVFDKHFVSFMSQTKAEASHLLGLGVSQIDGQALNNHHHANLELLNAFDEIEAELGDHRKRLSADFEVLTAAVHDLNDILLPFYQVAQERLKAKVDTPYLAQEVLSIPDIKRAESLLGQLLIRYSSSVRAVNQIIDDYKATLNATDLKAYRDKLGTQIRLLKLQIARHSYDSLCSEYASFKKLLPIATKDFEASKEELESVQKQFLDSYFLEINRLFRQLGSEGFEISRKLNNQGVRPVYDLLVSFNRREVSRKDFSSVFSESDRRALALCIFLAKLNRLPEEERSRAVVVLDDPCTSFDSERMRLIMKNLSQLRRAVKQLVVTTHYKQLAAQLMSQFNGCVGLKIVKGADGSDFDRATEAELTASAHDEHYVSIMEMIEGKTQEKRVRHLRPFLEHEVRQRFKAQLLKSGATGRTSFSECIDILACSTAIEPQVFEELSDYRNQLNPDMHELEQSSLADVQTFASDMMDFVYYKLRAI